MVVLFDVRLPWKPDDSVQ